MATARATRCRSEARARRAASSTSRPGRDNLARPLGKPPRQRDDAYRCRRDPGAVAESGKACPREYCWQRGADRKSDEVLAVEERHIRAARQADPETAETTDDHQHVTASVGEAIPADITHSTDPGGDHRRSPVVVESVYGAKRMRLRESRHPNHRVYHECRANLASRSHHRDQGPGQHPHGNRQHDREPEQRRNPRIVSKQPACDQEPYATILDRPRRRRERLDRQTGQLGRCGTRPDHSSRTQQGERLASAHNWSLPDPDHAATGSWPAPARLA